jgi:hypothetical protein
MPDEKILPLMAKFGEFLQQHAVFTRLLGWV